MPETHFFSELLKTLLAWILIAPAVYGAGRLVFFGPNWEHPLMTGIIMHVLGFFILSYGVVILSCLGFLSAFWIWSMVAFFAVLGCIKFSDYRDWWKAVYESIKPSESFFSKSLFLIFIVTGIALLLGTLTPELGGDALNYHLNLPKNFLHAGSLSPDFFDFNSYFPLFMNNLYLIGLATGGVFTAKLFHLATGVFLFLALKEVLDEETGNKELSYFIALIVWCTPAFYNLLSTTYIDVALACFTFLAVVTFIRAIDRKNHRMMFLSGLLLGCSLAMKYLALITMVGLAVVWFLSFILKNEKKKLLTGGMLFVAGVFLVSGYWFLRNWMATGNPFFPYWGEWFGLYHRPPTDHFLLGLGRNVFYFISMYFNMFLIPNAFGSFPTRIGIFYFLFLPFILLAAIFVPRSRGYVVFWGVFTFAIFKLAQADRWIIPALPVMALAGAFGIQWVFQNFSGSFRVFWVRFAGFFALLVLLVYASAGVYHYRYAYLLMAGRWSLTEYLTKLERTTDVSRWVNENLPRKAKIYIEAEARHYYFDRPLLQHNYFLWRSQNKRLFSQPAQFRELLKNQGVTHVLTADLLRGNTVVSGDSRVRRMLSTPGFAKEVFSGESRNIREDCFKYRVYKLL